MTTNKITVNRQHTLLGLLFLTLLNSSPSRSESQLSKFLPDFDSSISQSFNVSGALIYDTNPLLLEDEESVWLSRIQPNYKIQHNSEKNTQYIDLGLTLQRSTDPDISVNREDPRITVGMSHLLTNGAISATAGYLRRSTRISELSETGLVVDDGSLFNRFANLSAVYQPNARTTSTNILSYSNTTFSGSNQLRDFDSLSISSNLNYELNKVFSLKGNLAITEISRSTGKSYLANPMVGFNWLPSSDLEVDFLIGLNYVVLQGQPADTGFSTSVKVNYEAEFNSYSASYIRSVRPNGLGFQESERLNFGFKHPFNQSTSLSGNYQLNKNRTVNDIQAHVASINFDKKLNNDWGLGLYLKNKQIERPNGNASGNIIGFTINYGFTDYQDEY